MILNNEVILPMSPSFNLNLETTPAKVVETDQDGNPAFTVSNYGKGKVFFLNYPMEKSLFNEVGAFSKQNAAPYYLIYKYLKKVSNP